MIMDYRWSFWGLGNLLLIFGIVLAQGQYSDSVKASINGEVVTGYDVAVFANTSPWLGGGDEQQRMRNAARRLVENRMIYAEFRRNGWQVPDRMIEKHLARLVNEHAGGNEELFTEMLAESNQTLSDIREELRRQLAGDMLLNEVVYRHIRISPRAVENYYQEHKDDFVDLQLSTIMVMPNEAGAEDVVAEIKAALAEGKDFAAIAQAHDQDPEPATKSLGDLAAPLQQAVAKAKDGQVVGPVTLGNGATFFLKVHERQPVDDARQRIRNYLERQERQRRYQDYIERLSTETFVRTY